jgi:asparagine synthase (glutamine-hydrolysing)
MSVQFGKWNFDGRPIDPEDLKEVRPVLAPYGPDGEGLICRDNVAVLYRAFHTTKESRREQQPFTSESGIVITWDGRLDNREEIIAELNLNPSPEVTDLEIVAAGYERWTTKLFPKLIGDWALSVWDINERALILAKDFLGARPLYYSIGNEQVTWCTIIDPLILFAGHSFKVDEEYIAGWLSFFPAPHLTPYIGIHSVAPSTFVRIAGGTASINRHWEFDPAKSVRYHADAEYEDHFRSVFSESINRRLRTDKPVVAELSGGIDSSSIVCVADQIISGGLAEAPRFDTLSYYDNSEPNWNELPYIYIVEEKRGRRGCHINVSNREYSIDCHNRDFTAIPGSQAIEDEPTRESHQCLIRGDNRVLLSGIGGDEAMGGVPTPNPEIQDLLVTFKFRQLARQLKCWALTQRRPWFHLLSDAIQEFAPTIVRSLAKSKTPLSWLSANFAEKFRLVLAGYEPRLKLFGPRPSFQQNLATMDAVRRQLGCGGLNPNPPCDKRYPYLDRRLLEFLYSIPREQIIRPGQRRSLQRRALRGIVPNEILDRRRKAYVVRGPIAAISATCQQISPRSMITASLGIIDPDSFSRVLKQASEGKEIPVVPLLRTLMVESWLQGATNCFQRHGSHSRTNNLSVERSISQTKCEEFS